MPGLLYLLGQMSDHHARIAEHCERSLAADSPWRPACARIFDPEALSGSLRRSIVAYLGAQAAGEIPPDRLPMLSSTLACPECQGALEVRQSPEAGLHCGTCAHDFAFAADALDLRPRSSTPEAEFDEALVRRYESMTRPRFVRTMSRDWDRSLTPEVEEHYIARHLSTGDGPVLDVACGAGGWTEMVARQVGAERVLALDLSMPMVQACLDRVPRAIGICGDATRLPIQSGSLAAANCSDALQALPRPSDGLREISRCLRQGAPFTAFTFLEGDAMYRYFQHRVPLHARHLFSEAELRTTLDDVGLEVTDWSQRGLGLFFTARKR
jgi:ubiquinone/menaquinone biosynthesis C-methylase UbiE